LLASTSCFVRLVLISRAGSLRTILLWGAQNAGSDVCVFGLVHSQGLVCSVLERVRGVVQFARTRFGQEISTRSWTMHGNNGVLADKQRVCIESGRFRGVGIWRVVK
jgi:hypothetical protein